GSLLRAIEQHRPDTIRAAIGGNLSLLEPCAVGIAEEVVTRNGRRIDGGAIDVVRRRLSCGAGWLRRGGGVGRLRLGPVAAARGHGRRERDDQPGAEKTRPEAGGPRTAVAGLQLGARGPAGRTAS